MTNVTQSQTKSDQVQSVTVLGLLADDLALAAIRYPEFSEAETRAVEWFTQSLSQIQDPPEERVVLPRTRSMTDHAAILQQAVEAAQHETHPGTAADGPDLAFMREPLTRVQEHTASEDDLAIVRVFAGMLSAVTLQLAERLSRQKGAPSWTSSASTYSQMSSTVSLPA